MNGREIKPLSLHDYGSYYLINNEDFGIEVPAYMGIEVAKVFRAAPRLAAALQAMVKREAAQQTLLVDYRLGKRPTEKALDDLSETRGTPEAARAALREAGLES